MRGNGFWMNSVAVWVMCGLFAASARGQQTGVVNADHVNVRGQASLRSEVVTQLNSGDSVVILETISSETTGEEVGQWYRIALPTTAETWVSSAYIDPATQTVKATRLNVRSGPGQAFSVLGRIVKDTAVTEKERKGDWVRIDPPTGTYGFVAAMLVDTGTGGAVPAPVPSPEENPSTARPETLGSPAISTPVASSNPGSESGSVRSAPEPAPEPIGGTVVPIPIEPDPEFVTSDPVFESTAPAIEPPAELWRPEPEPGPGSVVLVPAASGLLPRRIVTREGLVKRALSIQAPTGFGLESIDTGKLINYLDPDSLGIKLDQYRNRRIRVRGEEFVDRRWPGTPILRIENIRQLR